MLVVTGSINVSSILNGELLGKVSSGSGSDFDSRRARALTDVNSLFLCETTNTLYTGTQDGCIHAWYALDQSPTLSLHLLTSIVQGHMTRPIDCVYCAARVAV